MVVGAKKELSGSKSMIIFLVSLALLLYGVGVLKVNPAVCLILAFIGKNDNLGL